MIWGVRIAIGVALAWSIYLASPFVALNRLGRAVEHGDLAVIRERVNFRAIRVSLIKQIANAYADEVGGRGLPASDRQLAVQAGMQFAEPLVERLVSPEVIIDLLDDGWAQRVASPESARPGSGASATAQEGEDLPPVPIGHLLRITSVRSALRIYWQSELRGFRHVLISLPAGRPVEERFQLRMRLTRATWRLVSLELPQRVLRRLLRRVPQPLLKGGESAGSPPAAAQ